MTPRRARRGALALAFALCGTSATTRATPKATPELSCPSHETPTPDVGSLDPFRPPAPKALELNAAGKIPYREGKWDEARAQYRAAEAANPEFLAPRLNVACSFVRQNRFAEATAEVVALLGRAYVPWAREILDAADLGALKVRPERKEIEAAMADAAARWSEGLGESLFFVARQRPPLRVPDGPGVFILNPHQEIWAYTPKTRRYRQLTAENGHVVALATSSDRRRIFYVTAEKLVRGAKPDDLALRNVAVRELNLGTMALGTPALVVGDVRRLAIYPSLLIGLGNPGDEELFELTPDGTLAAADVLGRLGPPLVALTGRGVAAAPDERMDGVVARQTTHAGTPPTVELGPIGGKLAPVKAVDGSGLTGLPIP